jgi:porphyrinogen peroxidase
MTVPGSGKESPPTPQSVTAPLSRSAVFLILAIRRDADSRTRLRALLGDLEALVRSVGFREPAAGLSCVVGVGSDGWDSLFGPPRPAELHPFREIVAGTRHAVATPGDLLFHIRASRDDFCFELATRIMLRAGEAVTPVDEVHGFRYFDNRDLIGFVDGTENPQGPLAETSVLIGDEDPAFASGSYVIVQKYLHDLVGWNALPTEQQEGIIGRKKADDVELDDAAKPPFAHNVLAKVVENGREVKILRDNMPFGNASKGEYGTYFIGYSRSARTTEQMLENMFVGSPPGNYDRLLDFSRAVTGSLFFVPSATFLAALSDAAD